MMEEVLLLTLSVVVVAVAISSRRAERAAGVARRQRRVVRIRVAVESEPATLFPNCELYFYFSRYFIVCPSPLFVFSFLSFPPSCSIFFPNFSFFFLFHFVSSP